MNSEMFLAIPAAVTLYLLPTLIALYRHANSTWSIAVLNLLLGWTLIMWLGASMWALIDKRSGS